MILNKMVKSLIYNTFYQLLIVLIPFITLPYLSRTLLPEQVGLNGYLMSIIQMMGIITLSGLGQYGVRKIKKIELDSGKVNINDFLSMYVYQIIIGSLCIGIYVIISIIQQDFFSYFMITLPYLVSNLMDVSWFFQGIERIEKIVFRNTIVKISTVILIFAFVKNESHFILYLAIMSFGMLIGNLLLWTSLTKFIHYEKIRKINLKTDVRTLYLLLPQLAIQLYITFDTTLLGIMSDNLQVAYYSQSQKIVRIIATIISSISIVMMPRMVANIKNKEESIRKILKSSYEYTLFFSLLFFIVIFINIVDFVPWFFGNKYTDMIPIMFILTPLIIFIPVGGVFSNQLAIALGRDKDYALPVFIGAALSILANFIMIPKYGALGAAITSLIVEFTVCLLRVYAVRDYFEKEFLTTFIKNIIAAIFVLILFGLIGKFNILSLESRFVIMAIKSILSFIVYVAIYSVLNREIILMLKKKRRK